MGGVGEAITWKNKISSVGDAIIYTGDKADDVIPTARQAELLALDKYPGTEQVSFFDGKEVPWGTPGATRPDIVRIVDDHIEAIEVKNYNLVNDSNGLYYVLKKQISLRWLISSEFLRRFLKTKMNLQSLRYTTVWNWKRRLVSSGIFAVSGLIFSFYRCSVTLKDGCS